ncbi:MAG: hypothetical protein ACI9QL_003706 [Candidatus Omnitrophota bacterium]|jgi:hypothetical protein
MNIRIVIVLIFTCALARAERDRLYTKPDPEAKGGLKGSITTPSLPVLSVLAIPPDEPRLVYEAKISGSDRREFELTGLPMRKYDLVVIYDDRYYEGLQLHRGESTLSSEDQEKIGATIQKAEKYFLKKTIHRLEGETGRGNQSRALVTYLRDTASTNGKDYRRSLRLIMLKDVGPGWQYERSRDLYPTWCKPAHAHPKHFQVPELGRIRVTDEIKDLGGLRLPEN